MNGRIFICNFARATDNGTRFDAIGAGINQFIVPQFPIPIAFALLIETHFSIAEDREHSFEIKIIDQDGKYVMPPIVGSIKAFEDHRGSLFSALNMQLLMKKTVSLTFSLIMNGEEKDSITAQIVEEKHNILPSSKQEDSKQ